MLIVADYVILNRIILYTTHHVKISEKIPKIQFSTFITENPGHFRHNCAFLSHNYALKFKTKKPIAT